MSEVIIFSLIWLAVGFAAAVWLITTEHDVRTQDLPLVFLLALFGPSNLFAVAVELCKKKGGRVIFRSRK